jgi:DivIVA domain-containing protein
MADDRRYTAADVPVTAEEVAHRGFSTAFRGFDPGEVRQYLTRVAESLRAARDKQRELELHVREVEARAAKPVLDEATLTNALGEHTARIIRSAHEAAADIRGKAEESVEQILKDAHEEASKLRAEAERALTDRVTEAEAEANAVRQAAEADAQGMRRRAQDQADRLLERARSQAKEISSEAGALRNRVMGDLMRRRRLALIQVEQLQAGRDQLLEAYRVVRRTLDESTDALQRAEADARAAAEAAAHRIAAEPEPTLEELGGEAGDPGDVETLGASSSSSEPPLEPIPDPSGDPSPLPEPEKPAQPKQAYSREPDRISSVRVLRPVPEAETAQGREKPPAAARQPADDPAPDVRPALKVVQPPSDVESVRVIKADTGPSPSPSPAPTAAPPPPPPKKNAAPEPATPAAEGVVEVADIAVEVESAEPEVAEPEPAPEVGDLFAKIKAEQDAPAAVVDPAPAELSPDEQLVARRDEALAPIAAALTRKLKRTLQDEQNEVLDRLRRHGSRKPSLAVAFPDGTDQRQPYRAAASNALREAVALGTAAAGGGAAPDEVVRSVADELADTLVAPLARRLEQALDEAASVGDDEAGIAARVSASYRDLKGARLERLAADHVGSAYAAGAFGQWAPGTPLRWIVRDVDGQCPDCDDNALAGPTPRGEAFPTGQVRPPAHAGCRCLLAPASA